MAGFGMQPAGSSSAGLGTPSTTTPEAGNILRDDKTGLSLTGRRLDPRTRDYVLDDNGRLLGMPTVRQLVQLAVMNAKPQLAEIDRLNDGFVHAATQILNAALQPFATAGIIETLGVVQATDAKLGVRGGLREGQAIYRYSWRDLTTTQEHQEPI